MVTSYESGKKNVYSLTLHWSVEAYIILVQFGIYIKSLRVNNKYVFLSLFRLVIEALSGLCWFHTTRDPPLPWHFSVEKQMWRNILSERGRTEADLPVRCCSCSGATHTACSSSSPASCEIRALPINLMLLLWLHEEAMHRRAAQCSASHTIIRLTTQTQTTAQQVLVRSANSAPIHTALWRWRYNVRHGPNEGIILPQH